MTIKKCVALLLICCMVGQFALSASASSLDDADSLFSVSTTLNATATQSVVQSPSDEIVSFSNQRSSQNMTLELFDKGNSRYCAEGTISTIDGVLDYSASGLLLTVNGSDWSGFIGVLSGTLSNNSPMTVSVHCVPASNKYFFFVSTGSVTEESGSETYVYGDVFDEMDYLVDEYWELQEVVQATETSEAIATDGVATCASASDYNPTLRALGVGRGTTNSGAVIDLCAVTFYSPRRVGPNESAKTYVKINGHAGNAAIFAAGAYYIPGNVEASIVNGFCMFGSLNDINVELTHLDPPDEWFNVSIPIPYYTSVTGFGTLPWDFNIGIYTIETEQTKHSGSIVYNTAAWYHNYSKDVSWTSSGAAATQVGYAGYATLTYHNNQDTSVNFSMIAGGNVEYQYRSYVLQKEYVGSFTATAAPVTVSITCDARN